MNLCFEKVAEKAETNCVVFILHADSPPSTSEFVNP